MNIKFHPHKGYLNTKFTLLYNGELSENFIETIPCFHGFRPDTQR